MQKTDSSSLIPQQRIADNIYLIRGQKVMLDADLARLYGVPTKQFNRAVLRNKDRFPQDFMFQISKIELENLRCQIGTSSSEYGGRRYLPYVFTEHGILMLSSVLNSQQAIQVNIQIMRTFTRLRELMSTNELLRQKIEEVESKNNRRYAAVFRQIKYLLDQEVFRQKEPPKQEIGFRDKK